MLQKVNAASAQSSDLTETQRICAQGSVQGWNPSGSEGSNLSARLSMYPCVSVCPCNHPCASKPCATTGAFTEHQTCSWALNPAGCSSNPYLTWAKSPAFSTSKWVKMCRIRLYSRKSAPLLKTTAILACQLFLIARLTAMWSSRQRQVLVISSVLPIPILLRQWHIKNSFHLFIYCMLGKLCHQLLVWKKKKKKILSLINSILEKK